MRRISALLAAVLASTAVHAASLQDFELNKLLKDVAGKNSVGTPRAINEDIPDQGYTAEGNQLINHLSVRASHAQKMRRNPDAVRSQLAGALDLVVQVARAGGPHRRVTAVAEVAADPAPADGGVGVRLVADGDRVVARCSRPARRGSSCARGTDQRSGVVR